MKLTKAQLRVLAKVQQPGYRFSLKNWPPGFSSEPYEQPHRLAGVPFGNALKVRERSWNGAMPQPTKNKR